MCDYYLFASRLDSNHVAKAIFSPRDSIVFVNKRSYFGDISTKFFPDAENRLNFRTKRVFWGDFRGCFSHGPTVKNRKFGFVSGWKHVCYHHCFVWVRPISGCYHLMIGRFCVIRRLKRNAEYYITRRHDHNPCGVVSVRRRVGGADRVGQPCTSQPVPTKRGYPLGMAKRWGGEARWGRDSIWPLRRVRLRFSVMDGKESNSDHL